MFLFPCFHKFRIMIFKTIILIKIIFALYYHAIRRAYMIFDDIFEQIEFLKSKMILSDQNRPMLKYYICTVNPHRILHYYDDGFLPEFSLGAKKKISYYNILNL